MNKNTPAVFAAVFALLIAITLTDHAFAQKKVHRDYFGVGGDSCGTWTAARTTNHASAQGNWLLGYLAALNLWGVIGRQDALAETDANGLYAWMDDYCHLHPVETIATGAGVLARELDRRAQ
jgi:hypothetical protein